MNARPIIVLRRDDFALGQLIIDNMGWGDIPDLQVTFGIAPAQDYSSADLWKRSTPYATKKIKLVHTVFLDVRNAISPFLAGQERVAIFGYISGAGPKLYFKEYVPLQFPGPEAYVPSTMTYQLELTAGKPETISLPIAQSIPPRSSDRFELRTVSDKSARFAITLEIYDTQKHVVGSDAMTIDLFRSRLDNEGDGAQKTDTE